MKRRAAVAILLASVIVGIAVASNMGFMQPYRLLGKGPESRSGTNLIALPYIPSSEIDTAQDLSEEIAPQLGAYPVIQRHIRSTDTFQVYASGTVNYALVPGAAYIVNMRQGQDVTFPLIGAHHPGLQIILFAPGPSSKSGTNFYAHPYHGVSATASQLFREIGSATTIQRLVGLTDTFQVYTYGVADFPLTPGEGLVINVDADVTFVPNHY